jgi:hypothetical protein
VNRTLKVALAVTTTLVAAPLIGSAVLPSLGFRELSAVQSATAGFGALRWWFIALHILIGLVLWTQWGSLVRWLGKRRNAPEQSIQVFIGSRNRLFVILGLFELVIIARAIGASVG